MRGGGGCPLTYSCVDVTNCGLAVSARHPSTDGHFLSVKKQKTSN
jgi:hypothetical protein